MTFKQKEFPQALKIANVIPVFNKGDKLYQNNYRLISLISNVSKLIETLIYKKL